MWIDEDADCHESGARRLVRMSWSCMMRTDCDVSVASGFAWGSRSVLPLCNHGLPVVHLLCFLSLATVCLLYTYCAASV